MDSTARLVGGTGTAVRVRVRSITRIMNILLLIIAVIAIVLLFTGGFVQSLNFLLWVGIVLLIIAAIVFLLRFITGNRAR
jgi:hypothetical protein